MQKCPLFWSKLDIFPVFCEILQNPPLFEKIPQFPILKNLSPLLGQKSHKTGKFPPSGHTEINIQRGYEHFIFSNFYFVSIVGNSCKQVIWKNSAHFSQLQPTMCDCKEEFARNVAEADIAMLTNCISLKGGLYIFFS